MVGGDLSIVQHALNPWLRVLPFTYEEEEKKEGEGKCNKIKKASFSATGSFSDA